MFNFFIIFIFFYLNYASDKNLEYIKELENNEGWNLIKKKGRVKIFSKNLNLSPLPAYRAEIVSEVKPNKLLDIAWLVEKSTEVFPNAYITNAGIYHKDHDTSYTAFQIFDIPFLSPRLYQFKSIRYNNKIYWNKIDTLSDSLNPNNLLIPPINFGSWEVESINDSKSLLIYRICTNPGGEIPLWIIEQANQRYLPLMLIDLETYAKEN